MEFYLLKRKRIFRFPLLLALAVLSSGCGKTERISVEQRKDSVESTQASETVKTVFPSSSIIQLEEGFSAVRYDGDYGFDGFLSQGGASSDGEVIAYLADHVLSGINIGTFLDSIFGCSTIAVKSPGGDALFGRNFDWNTCEAMVVAAYPENGYASVSTVNMDFISQNVRAGVIGMALRLDAVKTRAALYAPLDGMNEKGLAVSVNMIQDSETIDQNSDRPDITTTTAVRLLLDKAASVEEALELLEGYDLHGSMGMMIHFALADRTGRSVVVEYTDQEMTVTETPVVTNFYLTPGEKYGIGTQQSHERYEILMERLEETETMEMTEVRDALDSVSKDNFEEFVSTEWSIVFNLNTGEARYYHRENYGQAYSFMLEQADGEEEKND